MPTIIDSLLVKLGLDSSEFVAGKNKIDRGLKDTSKGFEDVAKSAAKFLAVLGGTVAIKNFVEQTIASSAALNRLSENLNTGVSDISAWSNAAELAGGSAEGLQGTLDMLSKAQTELMLTGQSSLIPYFSALGLSLTDALGKALPVSDVLANIGQALLEKTPNRQTANDMGRMMGIDQGTLNLILKGRGEVELMIKRQKEFGAVSKQQAEEASRLSRALTESKQTFSAWGRELLSNATPAIEKLLAIFGDFGNWVRENKEFVSAFLTIVAVGLAAIAAATIPINLTVTAVAALAAGIALLYQDYQTWKRGGDSLIDWARWEPGIKAAITGVSRLKDLMADILYVAVAGADAVQKFFRGDFAGARIAGKAFWEGRQSDASPAPPGVSQGAPVTSGAAPGGRLPRGIRNNNPGNLNYAGQAGASKESGPGGRFAVFGNMQEGVAALVRQIGLYVGRGKNTIRKILEVYAPAFENNTGAYIAAVSKALGIGADDPLDTGNAQQVMGLVRAITNHESGKGYVSDADIAGGYQLARGIPGASRAAAGAGAGSVAAGSATRMPGNSTNSTKTDIGEIKVYTQATDADGIARDIGKSMDNLTISQAVYGQF